MQVEHVPAENGEGIKCRQINLESFKRYIKSKHSGLHKSVVNAILLCDRSVQDYNVAVFGSHSY